MAITFEETVQLVINLVQERDRLKMMVNTLKEQVEHLNQLLMVRKSDEASVENEKEEDIRS